MRNPIRASIQRHLVFSLIGALSVLFGLSALAIYQLMRHSVYVQMDEQLERLAVTFATETERSVDGEVVAGFHAPEWESFVGSGNVFYQLRDAGGDTLIRSNSLDETTELPFQKTDPDDPEIETILLPDGAFGRVILLSFQVPVETFDRDDPGDRAELEALSERQRRFLERYDEADTANRVHLAIAEDTDQERRTLQRLAIALAVTGGVLLIATIFVIHRIVRRALAPVNKLTRITEEIGPDDLETQLPLTGVPNELRPLIKRFNALLTRVDTSLKREKRFAIDIAHELRTPIAEMRALLEVAVPEASGESGEVIRCGAKITRRMSRIIEALTSIHQAEGKPIDLDLTTLTVDGLLGAALDTLSPTERARIEFEPDDTAVVETDRALFRAIIDNLLQNALVHSPAGSSIQLSTRPSGFMIENDAPDLNSGDLDRLQEPFWKKDRARSDADRFGLGLTLVSLYLQQLGGDLDSKLKRGRLRNTVEIEKPSVG